MPILKNPQRETFCIAYVRSGAGSRFNATRAYIEAGYSEKGAAQSAHTLLRNPEVAARVAELQRELWAEMQMETAEILARMAAQARSSVSMVYDSTGKLRAVQDLSLEEAYAIQEITETVMPGDNELLITRKVKMRDPTQALRMLAQHKKLIGSDEAANDVAAVLMAQLSAARARSRAEDKP